MSRAEELTEEQWAIIEHLFPELQPRADGRSRPPADTFLDELRSLEKDIRQ